MRCAAILLVLGLAACAGPQQLFEEVVDQGAGVADNLLLNAENYICRISTVGAVTRRYFEDDDLRATWARLCFGDGTVSAPDTPVPSSPE